MRTLLAITTLALAGCLVDPPPRAVAPRAAEGPISRVTVGMDTREVAQLLGEPSATRETNAPKNPSPFYAGGGSHEVVHHYRSIGRVVFARSARNPDLRVIRVEGDRYEPGTAGPAPGTIGVPAGGPE